MLPIPLPSFGMKTWLMIAAGIVLALMIAAATGYFFWSQSELATLNKNVATLSAEKKQLTLANEKMVRTVDNMIIQSNIEFERNQELQNKVIVTRKEADRLSVLLQKHDLNELAARKPRLIERRVNDATKAMFDKFEALSNEK